MSVYKSIVEAIEIGMYVHQYKTKEQMAWFVDWWTGIKNVNTREIEKIINKVATDYKKV